MQFLTCMKMHFFKLRVIPPLSAQSKLNNCDSKMSHKWLICADCLFCLIASGIITFWGKGQNRLFQYYYFDKMFTPYLSVKATNGSLDGQIQFVESTILTEKHGKLRLMFSVLVWSIEEGECIIKFRFTSILFNGFTHSDQRYAN